MHALKEFQVYILHSHIISHVPTSAVKDILAQQDPEARRGKRIVLLLEYDLDIKPTKLIKGQGLAKVMEQSNCDALSLHMIIDLSPEEKNPKENLDPQVTKHCLSSPWYNEIIFVLQHLQAP